MNKGDELEFRATRFLSRLGFFSRRGIQLKSYFYPEVSDITDIDSYGIKWNSDLSSTRTLAMCTTERGKKETGTSNRILLVRGLMDLVGASSAYLVMEKMSNKLRAFSATNNVIPLDENRLSELESDLGLERFFASNNLNLKTEILGYYGELKRNVETTHHYWFLLSDFWFIQPNLRIKRIMNHIENLCSKLALEEKHEKWLYIESAVLLGVALLDFAFEVSCQPKAAREDYIIVKMIEGISTVEEQDRIRRAMYNIIAATVKEMTGKTIRIPNGDLKIPPPEYTELLIELVMRIIQHAQYAREMPRLMDYLLYESVIWEQDVKNDLMRAEMQLDEKQMDFIIKLGKNIILFMDPNAKQRSFLAQFLSF